MASPSPLRFRSEEGLLLAAQAPQRVQLARVPLPVLRLPGQQERERASARSKRRARVPPRSLRTESRPTRKRARLRRPARRRQEHNTCASF
jgi:hypothetical protein